LFATGACIRTRAGGHQSEDAVTATVGAPQRDYFLGLDALRGAGALIVITAHMPDKTLFRLMPSAHLGIDFFFMLSGFVVANAYLSKLERGMGLWDFTLIRLIRLYPLYFLSTVLGAAFFAVLLLKGWADFGWGPWAATLAANLFYIPINPSWAISAGEVYPFNVPAWTLFWELAANTVFALLALRMRGWFLAAVVFSGLVMISLSAISYGNLHQGWAWENFLGGGSRVWFALFAGVALHRLHRQGKLPRIGGTMPLVALTPFAVMALPASAELRPYVDVAVAAIVLPVLVTIAAYTRPRPGFETAFSSWAGRLSYGVYVLQMPIIMIVGTAYAVLFDAPYETLGVFGTLALMGAVVAAAWAADLWFDTPVRNVLRAWHKGVKPRAAAEAAANSSEARP